MIKNIVIFILVFVLLYFYLMEGTNEFCHNLIEERNGKIHVYNSNSEIIPGLNPLEFKNLEEYKKYMDWKKKDGSDCPVLYIKRKYTTQNQLGYQVTQDPSSDKIYTKPPEDETTHHKKNNSNIDYERNITKSDLISDNGLPGFDPTDQDIGKKNPIDMKY
jgi:hypothetical protein